GQKQTCSGRRGLWMGKNKLVWGVEAFGWAKRILFGASRPQVWRKESYSMRLGLRLFDSKSLKRRKPRFGLSRALCKPNAAIEKFGRFRAWCFGRRLTRRSRKEGDTYG